MPLAELTDQEVIQSWLAGDEHALNKVGTLSHRGAGMLMSPFRRSDSPLAMIHWAENGYPPFILTASPANPEESRILKEVEALAPFSIYSVTKANPGNSNDHTLNLCDIRRQIGIEIEHAGTVGSVKRARVYKAHYLILLYNGYINRFALGSKFPYFEVPESLNALSRRLDWEGDGESGSGGVGMAGILAELREALAPAYSMSPEGRAYLERMDKALRNSDSLAARPGDKLLFILVQYLERVGLKVYGGNIDFETGVRSHACRDYSAEDVIKYLSLYENDQIREGREPGTF